MLLKIFSFIYSFRWLLLIPLFLVFILIFSNDEPTRLIVRTNIFLICVYWLCLHFYALLFLILNKKVNQYLFLILFPIICYIIPSSFMKYTLHRYDGEINKTFESQYDSFFLILFAFGIIWMVSLFIKRRLFN